HRGPEAQPDHRRGRVRRAGARARRRARQPRPPAADLPGGGPHAARSRRRGPARLRRPQPAAELRGGGPHAARSRRRGPVRDADPGREEPARGQEAGPGARRRAQEGQGPQGEVTLRAIGYIPYDARGPSVEAGWIDAELGCAPRLIRARASLNAGGFADLPDRDALRADVAPLLELPWVVAEGPGGFLWAAILRAHGFAGGLTILPYLNPRRWFDVACAAAYRSCADPRDRVLVGSTPSARIYRALGLRAQVGEPFGVDCRRFGPRADAGAIAWAMGIPRGRLLLFAGRAQPDKDLYRLLRVGLRARLLFPDLQLVIASHVVDDDYVAVLRGALGAEQGVHLVIDPTADQLAALYSAADVFATAATSAFETFGRAPAEALVSGTPAV